MHDSSYDRIRLLGGGGDSERVVILARTKMNDGVCVGAYDVDNKKMLRLLTSDRGKLPVDAPYEVGELYELSYVFRRNLRYPHTEDVCVREQKCRGQCSPEAFLNFVSKLAIQVDTPENLFEGKLCRDGWGLFADPNDAPNFSVEIAFLNVPLMRRYNNTYQRWYYYWQRADESYARIPYVGVKDGCELPSIINEQPVRFSLARPWDKGDGVKRCALQISDVYN